jgi:hypothetical protein
MPETVKAVTGLNLEYSRFSLPDKTNPISVASVTDPDCNCSPSDPVYQFPGNWDTGPEQLDVFFYPRNYSGSDLYLFTGNQGSSRNITPTYPISSASVSDSIDNPYTPITLTKTENVFASYPNIPKKRVSSTLNTDLSYAVFYDTHLNISRKCWAGTGNLAGDQVLVIYSYTKQGISVVLCYLNGASTECIHSDDEAYGPHSVLIDLSPGTHFGSKTSFNILETFGYNDSYYYSLNMGNILTYYTFTSSFNGYFNGWYGWGYNYGLDTVYSGYFGYYNYVNNNYYYNHKQTSYAQYVKDAPLEGTSNWFCVSGRPLAKYHNIKDDSGIPMWRQTTEEEKETAIKSFGTGIDSFSYITLYWATMGAVGAVPEERYTDCYGVSHVLQAAIPAREADEEPDWENPWVLASSYEGEISYSLFPLLAGWSWYYWNYYGYNNYYLRLKNTNTFWSYSYPPGGPTPEADCYGYSYYNYHSYYYGGWGFNGYGPYSNGSWEINPDITGPNFATSYACGTPTGEITLGDGTTTYSKMDLLSTNSASVSWPRFGIDGADYQAKYTAYFCTPSTNPCPLYPSIKYKSIGSVSTKYTIVTYKVSTINLPINLGIPTYTRISDNDQEEFPLEQVGKVYLKEPGYLRSTYYGTIEPSASAGGRSTPTYLGASCYTYGYDSSKYVVYPSSSTGEEEDEGLTIPSCDPVSSISSGFSSTQKYLNLKFKAAYIPYFFGGVRPKGGLAYPANLTEPKVRIFSTDPPNPEEFRDSNYPKYYFQEFDPSVIMISESKLLEVPPVTVTTPPTANTKIYLPDYDNAITKTTILPRARTMLQTVAEQTEYFQCEYLKGEFNDWYYYFPPSFLSNADIDERLDFPENIYDCKNNITPTTPSVVRAAFLFDPNKGEEQLRSAGTSFNYYNYYNNLSISYLDYPEITAAIYNFQREVVTENHNNTYPIYLPAYFYMYGNMVYDYDWITTPGYPGMCYGSYGITAIAMGGTDICTPYTVTNGSVSSCGTNLKRVEPEYSVMTGYAYYDALDASRAAANSAYESNLTRMNYHSYPIPHEYKYVSSYTASGSPETGITCTPNYSSINYNWYVVLVDQAYGFGGGYYGGYSGVGSGFTKSYYDIDLPIWGRVSGLYWYGFYNFYNNYNSYYWPYNYVGSDSSFLSCSMIVANMGYNERKQSLTGNNLSSGYSLWYYGGYHYFGYGSLKNLSISDIGGYGSSVTFVDAGDLVKQNVPANCGQSCMTPTASSDTFYFDLSPVGGFSFFVNYGYGSYGYGYWGTGGDYYCPEPNTSGSGGCTIATEPVRLTPEFPTIPPFNNNNNCSAEDYYWVEPCTRFTS